MDSAGFKAQATLSLTVTLGPSGHVSGGLQAVTGASVQLWEAGTTGYGSTPTLLASATTDSDGNFAIPISTWSTNCTASGSNSAVPVYVTSSGGSAGSGANSAIVMMTAVGACNSVSATTTFVVNEATTISSAFALGPFMNPANPTQVGATATNQIGLASAFNTANDLVNTTTGTVNSLTPVGTGSVPQAELNSLADIVSTCVGGTSAECTTLEDDAYNSAGSSLGTAFTTPTNTLMAAQQIAAYPGNNVGALYGLLPGAPAFEPMLSSAPNDWSVAIQYATNPADTAASNNLTVSLAVDQMNNVWFANAQQSNVEEINNRGVPFSYSPMTNTCANCNSIFGPAALAIDFQGNAWVANGPEVFSLCANSGTQCSSSYTNVLDAAYNDVNVGLANSTALAFDGNGNLWIADNNTAALPYISLTELMGVGNSTSGTTAFANYSVVRKAVGIAIDAGNNAWEADELFHEIAEVSPLGVTLLYIPGLNVSTAASVTFDQIGNLWVVQEGSATLVEYSNSGSLLSGTGGYSYGSSFAASHVAVDGANRIWVTASSTSALNRYSLGEFTDSGTFIGTAADTGYETSRLVNPSGVAIDLSGNVWVGNQIATLIPGTAQYGAITKFVGLATPVQTPLASGLKNGKIAPKP
jgi:hypothetical protein